MSFGAILWSRIDTLYYGASEEAASKHGFEEALVQYRDLFADPQTIEDLFPVNKDVNKPACEDVFKFFKVSMLMLFHMLDLVSDSFVHTGKEWNTLLRALRVLHAGVVSAFAKRRLSCM